MKGLDLGDVALLPGLVDTHVHINEPGRTHWEGFATATRAAAAGGVTTVVDMPLNSLPPTTTVPNLEIKKKAAYGQIAIDVGFWGGAIPGNLGDLRPLWDAGVFGVKCFLSPSGVDEFPALDGDGLTRALRELARFDGLLIAHAEDPWTLTEPTGPSYSEFLDSAHPGGRGPGHRDGDRGGPGDRRAGPHRARLGRRRHRGAARGAGPRGADHRRDLPPLPDPQRRGGHRHRVQVLPADPRGGQPRRAVGGPGRRDPDGRRLRPLALPGRHEGPRRPRLRDGLGRDLLPPARPARHLDRGPVAGLRPGGRRPVDGPGTRRLRRALRQGPRSRSGPTPTWWPSTPTRTSSSRPGELAHKNPVTAYQGRRLSGKVQRTWLRGEAPGHGRFLTRGAR